MIEKLKSRKFWAAIVGVIVGIALAFGVDGDTITTVAGAATTIASVVVYIYTEGKIDAAAVNSVAGAVEEVVGVFDDKEDAEE